MILDPEFEKWAKNLLKYASSLDGHGSSKPFRRTIVIELHNELGESVMRYKVYGCWVSELCAQPEIDDKADAVAIERICLQNEGWELA